MSVLDKKLYIVIASNGVGGAEKRFVDIYKDLVFQGKECYLVLPMFLKNTLLGNVDDFILSNVKFIKMYKWSYIFFCFKLFFSIVIKEKKGAHFHYPLNPPFFLHFFSKNTFSISFCHSSLVPKFTTESFGLTFQRMASSYATRIDILNKPVLDAFLAKNPWAYNKVSLTPKGTYVSIQKVKEDLFKKNEFVFMSRLVKGKGVESFLKLIPVVNKIYEDYNLAKPSFKIAGDGDLREFVEAELLILNKININVEYCGFVDPDCIFKDALCVFSLQEKTNYPSRVVAEALSYGCNVIVLDVGDTRSFGNMEGLHYLNTSYNNLESILLEISPPDKKTAYKIAKNAKNIFSNSSYLDYFNSLRRTGV